MELARRVAHDIPDGAYVNLGIGMPETIAECIPEDKEVILHTENGLLGMGPPPPAGQEDPELINAGKRPVTTMPGASFFHHADSFAMIRGGHLDICVLGALEVAANGDLANWSTGAGDAIPAVGGAMDLVTGVKAVYVMTSHCTSGGEPKLVAECRYPLTGKAVVSRVYTDLAVIDIGSGWVRGARTGPRNHSQRRRPTDRSPHRRRPHRRASGRLRISGGSERTRTTGGRSMTDTPRATQSEALYRRALRVMPGGVSRNTVLRKPHPIYAAHASRCHITDVEGVERIDFANNMASLIHGHSHPAIVAAVTKQLRRGTAHTLATEVELRFAEHLCERVDSFEQIRFVNSGTEAVMCRSQPDDHGAKPRERSPDGARSPKQKAPTTEPTTTPKSARPPPPTHGAP